MDYKQAYLELFNTITDVIKLLETTQIEAESIIMNEATAEIDTIEDD